MQSSLRRVCFFDARYVADMLSCARCSGEMIAVQADRLLRSCNATRAVVLGRMYRLCVIARYCVKNTSGPVTCTLSRVAHHNVLRLQYAIAWLASRLKVSKCYDVRTLTPL
jgi:hypothetical protein